jgi:HSP20 family protein
LPFWRSLRAIAWYPGCKIPRPEARATVVRAVQPVQDWEDRMVRTANRLATVPFDRLFEAVAVPLGWPAGDAGLLRSPETEVVETEDAIYVVMEMPGVRRDDLDIGLEANVLTVRAAKTAERMENARYHLSERRYGTFARSFVLPRQVDADRIEAELTDGVLRIVVPKAEQARRRKIAVRGGETAGRIEASTEESPA